MDFDFPPDDDPRRLAARRWLADNPNPDGPALHEAGYVVPHWPEPYGIEADPMHQIIIDDELKRAEVQRPNNAIGIGWAAPTIFMAGSDEQKERYLDKIFTGEEIWCQMFSEPEAGSDLANLATRAERDGDEYVINGSKIWTSGGHHSDFGILIARTDPDAPKHKGISYFICPTKIDGVTMSPVIDMTTAHSFNQTFYDNVRLPVSARVGEEGDGWRLAKVTLANERVSLSSGGVLWGAGPSFDDLLRLVVENGGTVDPLLRQQIASVQCEAKVLELNRMRTLSARLKGKTPGPEASIQKLMADEHGQRVMELAAQMVGANAMLSGSGPVGKLRAGSRSGPTEINVGKDQFPEVDPVWYYGQLFAPALTIGGGTFAVQRNIVAEHVLGLPREPNLQKGMSWSEAQRAKQPS